MRFDLTEEQKLLEKDARNYCQGRFGRDALREFVSKPFFNKERWLEMANQGWLGAVVSEEHGGLGLGVGGIFPLLREAGKALVPLPLWESGVVASLLLGEQGDKDSGHRTLEALAEGRAIATVALFEEADIVEPTCVSLTARRDGDSFVLSGQKPIVAFGADADWLIVLARSDAGTTDLSGLTLFAVPANTPGVRATDLPMTDVTYRFAKVEFNEVPAAAGSVIGEVGNAAALLQRVIPRAQVALCAEMLGGCDKVLEMCVEYSKQRVQFGRPIGSFQAIKHRLADMYLKVSAAQGLAYAAVKEVDNGGGAGSLVKVAKAMCNDAYRFITHEGVQVHGGIAFTWEHDMHLYFKRALRYRNTLGTSSRLMYEVGLALAGGGL
ncbi:MAG: acyl-CoA dehydrogenase [Deltaproteobacteria bacterium]|nr:acyl-CoA dehydrogenase [Deltaproteobacteria bacterium]